MTLEIFLDVRRCSTKMHETWAEKCARLKKQWPVYDASLSGTPTGDLDIYQVLEVVSQNLDDRIIVVTDAGSPSYACPTNLKASTSGQFIFNPSQADMGWAVPASVGVALNAEGRHVVVIVGDGSFYSNVQELAVIAYHQLPVSIFVLNNDGYLSIRNTQKKYHNNRIWGVDSGSGLAFPPLRGVASAFGLDFSHVPDSATLLSECYRLMRPQRPTLVEIMCLRDQEILPAQAFRINEQGNKYQAPLHDMAPFLAKEELSREWPGSL